MSTFSRKGYQKVADVLSDALVAVRADNGEKFGTPEDVVDYLVVRFADLFEADSPAFKRTIFEVAASQTFAARIITPDKTDN